MAGSLPDELLLARIRKETAAREAAVAALYAALNTATADMQQKVTAVASKLSSTINGRTVNASAIAGQILRTQVEPGFALAEELTLLEAKVTDGQNTSAASIEELRTTTATQFESIAQQTLTIKAQFNGNVAYLQDQITVNANAISATATHVNTLDATVSNPTTGLAAAHSRITTEETVRASADSALSTRTTTLESSVNNPTTGLAATLARLVTEETTRANADSALSSRTTTLESTVNDATTGLPATRARLITEETTRANADSALSSSISTVSATANSKNKTFTQSTQPTASAVGDIWVDTANGNALKRWDGTNWVDTTVASGAINSAVSTEATARANADSALSTSISTVSATVGTKNRTFYQSSAPTATATGDLWIDTTGSTNAVKRWDGSSWVDTQVAAGAIGAAVSSEASARATADGNLSGKYSLKVIAGNIVTGMNITSSTGGGTDVSDVTFQASSFKVYNGTTGVAPFQVVGGVVKVTGSLVISSGDVSGLGTLATQNSVSTGQVTGLGGLATKSSVDLATSDVTNKSLANVDSTANTKLAGIAAGADVTLTAISGGLTIYSGGLTLSGTPSIQSSNYVSGSAGWAIKGDGSVEFNSGTFRGNLSVGTNDNNTQITSSGLSVGNTSAGIVMNGSSNTNYINIGSGRNYTLAMSGGTSTGALSLSGPGFSMGLSPLGYLTVYTSSDGTAQYKSNGFTSPYGSLALDGSGRWAVTAGSGRSIAMNTNGYDRWYFGSDGNFKTNGGYISKVSSDGWTPALMDGGNTIAFKWDGNFKVKIGTTEFTIF